MTDDEIINGIILREGDYSNRPTDKGGPTRWGITLETLSKWRRAVCTPEDVKNLSVTEAKAIYRAEFITAPGYSEIKDDRLRALVVDAGVNHGPPNATKMLQRALGLAPDGIFGENTREAVNAVAPGQLWMQMFAERIAFYGRIITNNPSQAEYAAGWMNRMKGLIVEFVS